MTLRRTVSVLLSSALLLHGLAAATQPRVLLMAIDAIGYDVVRRVMDPALGDKALFRGMHSPSAVIEAFPSDSYVAWTGLLRPFGVQNALGYEACYFSRAESRLRGCYSLIKVPAPWHDVFDWRLEGLLRKGIAYGWPKRYSVAELDQGLAAFVQSERPFFSMYIVSTDALGHLYGPDGQAEFLQTLDRSLQQLRREQPDRPFWTVIVTDHGVGGGKPLKNTRPGIETVLRKGGFRLVGSIEHSSDVTVVEYGLLSSLVVYTAKGMEIEVGSLLTSVPGVDLCVIPQDGAWRVVSARGDALVKERRGQAEPLWSYRMLTGDPLGYEPVVRRLRARAGDSHADWFPDSWWFEQAKHHVYPDALYRLATGFSLVDNPASIVCSISAGYMFGSLVTEYAALPTIGHLRWTHGTLSRDASLGVLLTDIPQWPVRDAVRFDQALVPLALLTHRGVTAGDGHPRN